MKVLVYNVCCFLISFWTVITVVGGVLMIDQLAAIQHALQQSTDIGNVLASNFLVLWLLVQAATWCVLVVPPALIAILTRPAWPMQIGSEISAKDRRPRSLAERMPINTRKEPDIE